MGNKNGQPVLRDEDVKEFIISSGLTEQEVKKKFEIFIKGLLLSFLTFMYFNLHNADFSFLKIDMKKSYICALQRYLKR